MRLILRHLRRCAAKRPLQPLILIVTVMLAVITSVFAYTVQDTVNRENDAAQMATYGTADLTVTLSGSSKSRFIFAKDAEKLIQESFDKSAASDSGKTIAEGSSVEGCYELPLVLGDDTVLGIAADLYGIGRIFSLEFIDYGIVTDASVGDVAFISRDLAESQGIRVGDKLTFDLMGGSKAYTVEGITKSSIIGEHDVIVDISGVVRMMASSSPVYAALGDSFRPSSTLYIKLARDEDGNIPLCTPEGESGDGIDPVLFVTELLSATEGYSDKTLTDVRGIVVEENSTGSFNTLIAFAVGLASLLSAVVIFCCFYILSSERDAENLSLAYAGASPRVLAAMQYTEAVAYWLIGAPLGVLASLPLTRLATALIGFKYAAFRISAGSVIKSSVVILLVSLLTVTFFIITGKRTRRSGQSTQPRFRGAIIFGSATLAILLSILILPPQFRFLAFIALIVTLVATVFLVIPPIICALANRIRTKSERVSIRYALKNLSSVRIMHNISRLTALALMITLVTCVAFGSTKGIMNTMEDVFCAEYAVINATDRCYGAVSKCESADKVYKVYRAAGPSTQIIGADDISLFSDRLGIDTAPFGNEATVASGFADMNSLKVGDSFAIKIDGIERELVVGAIRKSSVSYVAIDCEDMGVPYNMLMVRGGDGVSRAELLNDISAATAGELSAVVSADTMLSAVYETSQLYLNMGMMLLSVFMVFSFIGILDVLSESIRARKDEFELYHLAGMERRKLGRMRRIEITASLLLGTVIGLIASLVATAALDMGMTRFGYELFISVSALIH